MRDILEIIMIVSSAITCAMALVLLLTYIFRFREGEAPSVFPSVTVFVPFFNENEKVLLKTLEKLDQQCYPEKIQVVIIDDGSTNNSSLGVERWIEEDRNHCFVLLHRQVNGGRKGYALDYALESGLAEGEVYIVVDSDTYIEPDGVYELSKKLWSDNRYAAVCGYIAPENYDETLLAKLQYYEHVGYYGAIRCAQDRLGLVPVLAGAFVAHRASAVKEIGGWSDWLVEDIAWCWSAIAHSYRTGYAPRAVATTQCPITHKGLFNQRRRWARGRVEAYMAAWRVSSVTGLVSTPWFLLTALQYLFPPSLILVPLLVYLNIFIPVVLGLITMMTYFLFFRIYQHRYKRKTLEKKENIIQIVISTMLLESIVWLPNILGYADELRGKRKKWLTR